MAKYWIALFCLLSLAPRPAAAMYVSSAELSAACQSDKREDIYACTNYIAGVIDYHILLQSLGTQPTIDFCLPDSITMQKAAVLVMAYLKTAPQHSSFVAAASIPLALNKVFPCHKQPLTKKNRK